MKKFLYKVFNKSQSQPVKRIRGITEDQHAEIRRLLCEEYDRAKRRQTSSKVPSAYMKGLQKAIEIVGSFESTYLD